jgi:hypothetical protein
MCTRKIGGSNTVLAKSAKSAKKGKMVSWGIVASLGDRVIRRGGAREAAFASSARGGRIAIVHAIQGSKSFLAKSAKNAEKRNRRENPEGDWAKGFFCVSLRLSDLCAKDF